MLSDEQINMYLNENLKLVHHIMQNKYNIKAHYSLYDDIYQCCLIDMWEALKKYNKDESRVSTYLWVVIKNAILMYFRDMTTKKRSLIFSVDEYEFAPFVYAEDCDVNIISDYNITEIIDWLYTLEVRDIKLFIDHYVYDVSPKKLAEINNSTANSVNTRISKCKKIVQELAKEKFIY